VYDVAPAALTTVSALGCHVAPSVLALVRAVRVVVVAVKPDAVAAVLADAHAALTADHLLVSIAAGVDLATLAARTPPGVRLVRAMPNTPCLVGHGATALAAGRAATAADVALVTRCALTGPGR
jgi:pyrroline-5-carboxylate reductase